MDRPLIRRRRPIRKALLLILTIYAVSLLAACTRIWIEGPVDRRAGARVVRAATADAPSNTNREALVQVYAARTWGFKKMFAVHTWIAVRRAGDRDFTTWQVIGWRLRRGGTALITSVGEPDRPWYGNPATLLVEHRGDAAAEMIDAIERAVAAYPHAGEYRAWPGPNSNTFTAFVAREVPALALDLPSTAIGKDYLTGAANLLGATTAGDGWQFSLFGLLGAALSPQVGLELNVLGLNLEFDVLDLAVELPGFGRVGAGP